MDIAVTIGVNSDQNEETSDGFAEELGKKAENAVRPSCLTSKIIARRSCPGPKASCRMNKNGVATCDRAAKPNGWRLQSSLRVLLGLVLALSLPFFIGFLKLDEKRRERAFVADVRRIGGHVVYEYERDADSGQAPGPAWIRRACFRGDSVGKRLPKPQH